MMRPCVSRGIKGESPAHCRYRRRLRLMPARSEQQTVPLDEQEIRLLRSKRLDKSFALMLIVDAMIVIGVIYASVATPDFPDFWAVICLIPVAFILSVITLGTEAEWRFLRKDLQAVTKACCDGHIASLCMHDDGESPTTYRIGVVVDDPESPLGFSVPQEVYDAVEEGQAVRSSMPRSAASCSS